MQTMLVWPVMLAALAGETDISTSAKLNASNLQVGSQFSIELMVEFGDGADASKAGVPAPILQIELPESVELVGKVLKTQKELAGNEYLRAPYERLLQKLPASIKCKLKKAPGPDDTIFLNIVSYVQPKSGDAEFVRKRLALPVKVGATSQGVSSSNSDWGIGDALKVGDKSQAFELPRADGSKVSLAQFLGKKNVVVTTYRAFW